MAKVGGGGGISAALRSTVVAVIPARYASTRFPGKLLHPLHGASVLAHVIARAREIRGLDGLWIATDDERIAEEARRSGAAVRMTSAHHPSGTDRIGEALAPLTPQPDIVLNLQGDEPLFSPAAVGRLIEAARLRPDAIWTLAHPIREGEEFLRPDAVKVVLARDGRALYFSRSPIPFFRAERGHDPANPGSSLAATPACPPDALRHVGVYAYPRALLASFLALPQGRLERLEGLEQLRALEAGIPVRVQVGAWPDAGIDTPEDLERVQRRYPTAEDVERAGREAVAPPSGSAGATQGEVENRERAGDGKPSISSAG